METHNEQQRYDAAWLDRARQIVCAQDVACLCKPTTADEIRWPGYLGRRYAEKRVLLVGSRHNGDNLFTQSLRLYHDFLRVWSTFDRAKLSDFEPNLLNVMREAHTATFPQWSRQGVWLIFAEIAKQFGFDFEQMAFTNLALCYEPGLGADNDYIPGCQDSFALNDLVRALEPQLVFFAKGAKVGRDVRIEGEDRNDPVVIRYGSGSWGKRNRLRYDKWIPLEIDRVKMILPGFFV